MTDVINPEVCAGVANTLTRIAALAAIKDCVYYFGRAMSQLTVGEIGHAATCHRIAVGLYTGDIEVEDIYQFFLDIDDGEALLREVARELPHAV